MGLNCRDVLKIEFYQISLADFDFEYQMVFRWASALNLVTKCCPEIIVEKIPVTESYVTYNTVAGKRGRRGHTTTLKPYIIK